MAMMVPMMLPSLVPVLSRYRRFVRAAIGMHELGLTTLVAAGYFVVWAAVGVAAWAAGTGVMAVAMRWRTAEQWLPAAAGVMLLVAGGVQLSEWKSRQLALWREGSMQCGRSGARPSTRGGMGCAWASGAVLAAAA